MRRRSPSSAGSRGCPMASTLRLRPAWLARLYIVAELLGYQPRSDPPGIVHSPYACLNEIRRQVQVQVGQHVQMRRRPVADIDGVDERHELLERVHSHIERQ